MTDILVIDVEATCWQSRTPPPGQQSEIIEIGLCLLDTTTYQPHSKRSILIRPQRSKVSSFCTELTTLTQAQVDTGISFEEACVTLIEEYQSRNLRWASYGDYDRKQFEQQCPSFGVPYPFGEEHINVKKMIARKMGWRRAIGMSRALQNLNLALVGTHHRGHDDAWNIARILALVLEDAE